METTQYIELNIDPNQPADSETNLAEAAKVFGAPQEKAGEFWNAMWGWSREKGEYHSLELYNYAKTLSRDPDELFLIGVIAATIVIKTAVEV